MKEVIGKVQISGNLQSPWTNQLQEGQQWEPMQLLPQKVEVTDLLFASCQCLLELPDQPDKPQKLSELSALVPSSLEKIPSGLLWGHQGGFQ